MHTAIEKAGVELIVASAEGPKIVLQTQPKPPRPRPRMRKVIVESAPPVEEKDAFID
jgi:hypothetical protein